MKKHCNALFALLLVVCFAASARGEELNPKDQAAIRAVLDHEIEAWNHHDMKAYVADMTEDVQWVNVTGMWWRGRDEVYRAHEAFHQTIFKNRNLYPWKEVSIRGIAPHVAIVTATGAGDGFTGMQGRVFPPSTGILTFVLVQKKGRWLITAAQNTRIDEEAAKNNPAHHE